MSQAKAIFEYKDIKINISCQSNEKMRNIIERFTGIVQIDKNKTIFFYDGDKINEELNFNELANEEDKLKNQINIILFEINNKIRCHKMPLLPRKSIFKSGRHQNKFIKL